jgi:hypothetical protein
MTTLEQINQTFDHLNAARMLAEWENVRAIALEIARLAKIKTLENQEKEEHETH